MRRKLLLIPCAIVLLAGLLFVFSQCVFGGGDLSPGPLSSRETRLLQDMTTCYDATAHITYRGVEAAATISQVSPEACTVTFTAPESLKNMAFTFSQDNVEVGYKGLSFGFDPGSVPGNAVARTAVAAINAALRKENIQLEQTDSALLIKGGDGDTAFSLELDLSEGSVRKLSVPGQELEIVFENFTFFK